jgi:phenylpyruvate tautomerase PptA (4-oxalocrotonate tautomerase family)
MQLGGQFSVGGNIVNSKPERTHIIYQEIARDNWAFDGGLVCDRQSQTK